MLDPTRANQKQETHLANHQRYEGGGYFNSIADAQAVLDAFRSGTAEVLGVTRSRNIVVRVEGVTGYNHNPRAGCPNQPTDVFFIKGPIA